MTTNQDGPNTAGAAELKACPFCGAAASLWGGAGLWAVSCNMDGTNGDDEVVCGMEGPPRITQAEAIAAWNARPSAGAAEPVAWMYTSPHGDKELILNYGCEYAKRLRKSRWTETPLYPDPPENPPQRPSVDPAAYAVMNPTSGSISAPPTGQLYNASASVVPDEVVEAVAMAIVQCRFEDEGEPITDYDRELARAALTAAIPAIKAQVLAEIVAWLRMGEHVHSRSGSIESERVFKLIADAIERGEHEND